MNGARARDARQIFVIHIPRTAGTSLRAWLREAVGADALYWTGPGRPAFAELPDAEIRRLGVIGGHIAFPEAHWGLAWRRRRPVRALRAIRRPPRIYCAVMREPVEALVSHFEHVERLGGHGWATGGTLDEALARDAKFLRRSRGLQCHYLSGWRRARPTLARLSRTPFVVGTLDRLDDFVEVLSGLLGGGPELPRLNGAPSPPPPVAPALRARLAELTAEDRAVYEAVRARGVWLNLEPRSPLTGLARAP